MGLALLALVLAAPFPPELGEPVDGAWVNGNGVYLWWDTWTDDAGVEEGLSRLEFRRFDGGYGAFNDTQPWSRGRYTTLTFPVENEWWCWRAFNINANNEMSPPSAERCFRTDNSDPVSPNFVDAGAVISTGRVVIEHSAAVDAVSGVAGYILALSRTPTGPNFYDSSPLEPGVPLVTYVGEGTWFGWIKVEDFALNSNNAFAGEYTIPITITAVDAGFVPAAPAFWDTVTPNYGSGLEWDAGLFAANNVTHVVGSFCNTETACQWQHAFVGVPVNPTDSSRWVHLGDEGTMVARIAVVIGGQVGPWSAPSAPIVVDRTQPPRPTNVAVMPSLSNQPNFTVSWYAASDERSGLDSAIVVERFLGNGSTRNIEVGAPTTARTVTLMLDGRYEYRVRSVDRAGNVSDPSMMIATATLDRRGPNSTPPMATAVAADGGALVTVSWSLPTDELSPIVAVELREEAMGGLPVTTTVTGVTSVQRFVGAGTWTWRTRGTDEATNVGNFSMPSNSIVVTPGGVAQGPAITSTGPYALTCGAPFVTTLEGTGDSPLTWSLLSGPPLLTMVGPLVAWVPPAGTSGAFNVEVKLNNDVGFVSRTLVLNVACGSSSDGGTDGGTSDDGGSLQQPPRPRRDLNVGCGCTSANSLAVLALSLLALARTRRRS